MWYCQLDVSPVNVSDSDQMGHFMLDTICKVENVNPFYLSIHVHLEKGEVQQSCGWEVEYMISIIWYLCTKMAG